MIRLKRIEKELQLLNKHYEVEIKLRIMGMFESPNVDKKTVLKMFGITEQTLYNGRRAFDKDGLAGLESSPHSGRKPWITPDELMDCIADIKENNLIATPRLLQKIIFDKHKVKYSMRGQQAMLNRNRITLKKIESVHRNAVNN